VDLSFILAAAEHAAEEHHKSELPFFIAGGLLASFAVLISVFGFKRPDFPASDGAARGVMAVSTLLVAGAMAMIIYVNT
jgi:hypothetical protein